MGFTSTNNVPTVLQRGDSTLILRFSSSELTSAFENVLVTSFSKAYPTAEKMNGGKADTLKLVYRINITAKRALSFKNSKRQP